MRRSPLVIFCYVREGRGEAWHRGRTPKELAAAPDQDGYPVVAKIWFARSPGSRVAVMRTTDARERNDPTEAGWSTGRACR